MTGPHRSAWRVGACGVLIVLACARHNSDVPKQSQLDQLLDAAPASWRANEARVTGLRWAPARKREAGRHAVSSDDLELQGIVGTILANRGATSASAHLTGVGYLLIGRTREAVTQLEEAARKGPSDARAWSDLSAARYTLAVAADDPARLPAALAAADRALQLSPSLAPAHFNRALILERLGLRNEARRQWHAALAAESDDRWTQEGRQHLSELEIVQAAPLGAEIEHAAQRAREGDNQQLRALVAQRVEEIRASSETVMVTAWAEAAASGDTVRAEQLLTDLRRLGELLAAMNGDYLLQDTVKAIDATPPAALPALFAAHKAYRDARLSYSRQLPRSDAALAGAAVLLARAHSPLQYVARYYAANAAFDRNRAEKAHAGLLAVLRDIDQKRYPSLTAGVTKQLGLYYGFRGMWTASLIQLERSKAIFSTGGETVNAAFTDAIIGEVYDRIGQFEKAWRHRRAALSVLCRAAPSQRSLAVLGGAVHAEILRCDFESALSLLAVARREADAVRDPVLTAEMMIRQASVLLRARGAKDAQRALSSALAIAQQISDPRQRRLVAAEAAIVRGESTESCGAVAILTPSIEQYEGNRLRMLLPGAYLARGRARLACKDARGALTDFRKGVAEIERQRANVAMDIRTTIFDTVPDLIAETLDLLLSNGRTEEAYALVERARARTLIEALGLPNPATEKASLTRIVAALPPNAALIEYALLPHAVAAFCITQEGMTVKRLKADPAQLREQIAALDRAIDARDPLAMVQVKAAELHDELIAPLEPLIGCSDLLYIVPDRFLYAAPFAALWDRAREQYLIEKHRLVIAPSSAFVLQRLKSDPPRGQVLIVSDPSSDAAGNWLPAAHREGTGVELLYGKAKHLFGADASIERFVAEAKKSSLIHYAGHAGVDDAGGGFLPLARSRRSDGRLEASAISRLSLRRTRLVVLSACATMRGTASRIEGMPSVSRAFLTAGVPLVLGMLWEVDDDATTPLLLSFHRQLLERMSPSAALRATQCALLRSHDPTISHPASWAAAELIGVD